MKSVLILLASAAMLATTSAQFPNPASIISQPTSVVSGLTSSLGGIPFLGPILSGITGLLGNSSSPAIVKMAEQVCNMTIGKVAAGVCDFSILNDLKNGKYAGGCNPIPVVGGSLTIVVDLAVNDTCPTDITICVNSPSILNQLLTFLTCALPQLPDILSKVGTILDAVAADLAADKPRSLLVNAALFLVYVVLKKVLEILCLQLPILVSVLITLGPILFMVLLALGIGLGMSSLPLLVALAPVVMALAVLVGGLVSGLSVVLLGLVVALQPLLLLLSALLIALLSVLLGIKSPCSDSACGSGSGSTNPLQMIPFGDALNKLRCTFNGVITKLMAPLQAMDRGVLDGLLGALLPLVSSLLKPVSGILSSVLKTVAKVLIDLSSQAIKQ